MHKYRIIWYNLEREVKTEPSLIIADNAEEAKRKAYQLYEPGQEPAPLCSVNLVE